MYQAEIDLAVLRAEYANLERIALSFAQDAKDIVAGEYSWEYEPSNRMARVWYKKQIRNGRIIDTEL